MLTEEIKAKIATLYDETQLLDLLDIDMDTLVEILRDRIEENIMLFYEDLK